MPRNIRSAKILKVTVKSNKKSKPNKQTKPQQRSSLRTRGNPKRKGLLSTALDVGEHIAGFLPGAIRGVRSMFNMKQEAEFATPASFAVVQNNVSQMKPEQPVTHPTLGISGMRVYGCQPLAVAYNPNPGTGPFFFPDALTPAVTDTNTVLLNPILLGGPLSVYGFLYDRYVFRALRVKFVTSQTTTYLGTIALCIEKDPVNVVATSFNTARQVTPNLTYPIRIPKAELDWAYDGPDVFYTNQSEASGSLAQTRQDIQSVLKGYLTAPIPLLPEGIGFFDIEYVIDFFDPVPPASILGTTLVEQQAMHFFRQQMAKRRVTVLPRPISLQAGRDSLLKLISEDFQDDQETKQKQKDDREGGASAASASASPVRRF
jgi:hypothetical protein